MPSPEVNNARYFAAFARRSLANKRSRVSSGRPNLGGKMATMEKPEHTFAVTLVIEGVVRAHNAGDAIGMLSGLVRRGIGEDVKARPFETVISHGSASMTYTEEVEMRE